MTYAVVLAAALGLFGGNILGYLAGRYQSKLADKIRTLEEQVREASEPKPEPEKPTVTAGAYRPPSVFPRNNSDIKKKAGLVETKTPELLDWENQQEIENLGNI